MARTTLIFTISVPPEMAIQIESAMKREHRTRSELVREALRLYMHKVESRARSQKEGTTPSINNCQRSMLN